MTRCLDSPSNTSFRHFANDLSFRISKVVDFTPLFNPKYEIIAKNIVIIISRYGGTSILKFLSVQDRTTGTIEP